MPGTWPFQIEYIFDSIQYTWCLNNHTAGAGVGIFQGYEFYLYSCKHLPKGVFI